jgi:YHS domain-containing protein
MEAHGDEVRPLRFLIWLLLGVALYWALRELTGSGSPDRRDVKGEGEEMVRDPQCGVYLPLSSALKRRVRGENVYFCSRECEVLYNRKTSA